ncbi:hypothetical protein EVAR_99915_1 [Eumeta japonica]|uniref:Uncharacterized protein n=1 Tax=Eumeta variegata TaxID=151549 RepID=A0A4C2A9J5_EUMVA|nr:hypothetical protein EVAR_99915_1 [Eumeta japonica]
MPFRLSSACLCSVPLSSVPDITYHVCVKECNVAQYLPCVDSQLRAFVSNIPYRAVSTTHRVFARFMRLGCTSVGSHLVMPQKTLGDFKSMRLERTCTRGCADSSPHKELIAKSLSHHRSK